VQWVTSLLDLTEPFPETFTTGITRTGKYHRFSQRRRRIILHKNKQNKNLHEYEPEITTTLQNTTRKNFKKSLTPAMTALHSFLHYRRLNFRLCHFATNVLCV